MLLSTLWRVLFSRKCGARSSWGAWPEALCELLGLPWPLQTAPMSLFPAPLCVQGAQSPANV